MDGVTSMVQVGKHSIRATVFGDGSPAVVIEPALGGYAEDWRAVAEAAAEETTVITYDRAPYGASSPASDDRTPAEIARDLHLLLHALGAADCPLVLVGHSLGGVYVRKYTAMFGGQVAGMVLVDSSSEGQQLLLRQHYSPKDRFLSGTFRLQILLSTRAGRGGADRRSLLREYRAFTRLTAADTTLGPGELGNKPLVVLTRRGEPARDRLWAAWHGLQRELVRLSANSRHVISASPAHYLNQHDPGLIIDSIRQVVSSVRTSTPLTPAASSDELTS